MTSILVKPSLPQPINTPTVHQLSNGLTIVAEQLAVDAVNLNVWINIGSAIESDDINGMAHFLEHIVFKGTPHLKAAQKFVDFLLTKEGQEIIASTGTLPIRDDVAILKGFNLVPPKEAEKRAMKIDYLKMLNEKEAIIQKFTAIMRGR